MIPAAILIASCIGFAFAVRDLLRQGQVRQRDWGQS
jgi:hypothetical protein